MNAPQMLEYLTRNGVKVWREGERLQIKPPKPLKPELMELAAALKSDLLSIVEERTEPTTEATPEQAGTTQGASPEHWEIAEGLRFNGGGCAARLLVALCRLSHNVKEIEARLREGEPLGLWRRTERTDALGFPVWEIRSEQEREEGEI